MMNLLLGSLPQTGDLSLLGGSKPTGEMQNTGFDLIFDQLLASLEGTQPADEKSGSLSLININTDELLFNPDNKLKSVLPEETILINPDALNDNESLIESKVAAHIENNVIGSLSFNTINNKEIKNNQEKTPLVNTTGKFEVQSWSVEGDYINLELIAEENPDTTINISLPSEKIIDQLISKNLISASAINRIPLDGQKAVNSTQLEMLMEKYDIKEIHIENSDDISANKADEISNKNMVDVEIFAQNAGQEIVLKSKLNKNEIQIKKESVDLKSLSQVNKSDKVISESGESKFSTVKQSMYNSSLSLAAKSIEIEKLDFLKQFSESGTQQDVNKDNISHLPDFIKSPNEMILTKDKVDLQPVRFTLPDNINAQLKPNGKSIRINIEPNHLGPARLSLNMQNDKLSAVVTVHSAQAKMTVEGSLDRLLDALNKANIQVDYIDVNVNQENNYEQFAQQRSNYFKQQVNRNFSLSDYLANEESIIENRPPNRVSYINAQGVNLTA